MRKSFAEFRLKSILSMVMLIGMLVINEAYSMNPLDRANINYNYGTYWRLNSATYSYDIIFYENGSADGSFVGKFPFTLTSGETINNYNDIINLIILPEMQEFNNLNFGLIFNYDGSYTISSDPNAYKVNDTDNTTEIEMKYNQAVSFASWDDLNNHNEFGFIATAGPAYSKNTLIHQCKHEMLHCLGFSHKPENLYGFGNPNWNAKSGGVPFMMGHFNQSSSIPTECTEDSIYGINIIYNSGREALKIEGYVTNYYSDGNAEIYLVNSVSNKQFYQAPIDKNGKFESRLRLIPSNPVKLLACNSIINKNYSVVKGIDNQTYSCTADHTSALNNKPITGQYWSAYWILRGDSSNRNTWVQNKNYKAMNIRYQFTSNLPIPQGANYFNAGNISFDRLAYKVEDIQGASGIKMIYP